MDPKQVGGVMGRAALVQLGLAAGAGVEARAVQALEPQPQHTVVAKVAAVLAVADLGNGGFEYDVWVDGSVTLPPK